MFLLFVFCLLLGVTVPFAPVRHPHPSTSRWHMSSLHSESPRPLQSTVNVNATPRLKKASMSSKGINKAIVEAFAQPNATDADMERLRLFLDAHGSSLNQVNVITLMHRCGKHKRDVFAFAPQVRVCVGWCRVPCRSSALQHPCAAGGPRAPLTPHLDLGPIDPLI